MKKISNFLILCALLIGFGSCMKDEKPYPIPEVPQGEGDFSVQNAQVHMGEDYETQIFFSFVNGVVHQSKASEWDIAFSNGSMPEIWMNGGKKVRFYPTGSHEYTSILEARNLPAAVWKFDASSGLEGKSALGILTQGQRLGEVIIVDNGEEVFYKFQIMELSDSSYKVKLGALESTLGEELVFSKDDDYNYTYYAFEKGIVSPEPPKRNWDIVFTKYRHIYYGFNDDGTDFPYYLNGVLTNPYSVQSAKDTSELAKDFYAYDLAHAQALSLASDRDVIGFDWKKYNLNTDQYIVDSKRLYIVKDVSGFMWKLRFMGFTDDRNVKGSPKFEYQRLQ